MQEGGLRASLAHSTVTEHCHLLSGSGRQAEDRLHLLRACAAVTTGGTAGHFPEQLQVTSQGKHTVLPF